MRKTLRYLLMLFIPVLYSRQVTAQTDTSSNNLDLGKINLKKEFTQSIVIKGEDLEKMPFTSLTDAINVWTYGQYSIYNVNNAPPTFIYVVDGNLLTDVNAYSIHDIKEITLVQNALIQLNGASRQQLLVAITTRKGGPGKQGITVAGQSFLTKGEKERGLSSESAFYHQYTVSAYKHTDQLQFGAAVNYQRNVFPSRKEPGTTTYTPSHMNRFRINAWLNAQLGSQHELYMQLNTAPQQEGAETSMIRPLGMNSSSIIHNTNSQKRSSFNPTIGLRSSFLKNFHNHISVSYLTAKTTSDLDQTITNGDITTPGYGSGFSRSSSTLKTELVLIRDNINYTASFGSWRIEPAANFTFRYRKSSTTSAVVQQAVQSPNNPPTTSSSIIKVNQEGRSYFLTPSISLSYKNIFNLQGGLFSNLSSNNGKKMKRAFPFITTTFNVLPPDQAHATSLQLFGSYAQTDDFGETTVLLEPGTVGYNFYTQPIFGISQYPDSSYWSWQAGTRIGLFHDRLSINYNFEQRDYTAEFLVQIPGPTQAIYMLSFPSYRSSAHHINVNVNVFNTGNLHWRTGITATNIKTKIVSKDAYLPGFTVYNDFYWTGGWVNRLSWKQFSAGADLLYNFTKDRAGLGEDRIHALTIQNIYVGYQFALKRTKGLELYADARNLAQHSSELYKLGGSQKYYGIGFKLNL